MEREGSRGGLENIANLRETSFEENGGDPQYLQGPTWTISDDHKRDCLARQQEAASLGAHPAPLSSDLRSGLPLPLLH